MVAGSFFLVSLTAKNIIMETIASDFRLLRADGSIIPSFGVMAMVVLLVFTSLQRTLRDNEDVV